MSTTDDIKSKIDLAEYLLEQGVQLKQAGASLKACCPFHNEKSPSFMVNRQKQVWFCFGCSKGGDLFTFVQEREGLEFSEALKLLAERAGVQLEARDPRLEGQKIRSLDALTEASAFFRRQLGQSAAATRYVTERGIAEETAERFQIGYAPDSWDTLATHLVQRGFRTQEIVDAGLASPGKRSGSIYDRFRHRLMFPIHDIHGRIVGFTGRVLEGGTTVGDAPAKYVNTPETALYKKSEVVYGLVFAKDAIRTAGYALLVEGQMDVVTSHAGGLAQTVATSGTAFTEQQLRILKRFTSRLHLAFDADAAGVSAAERGIDAALDAAFDVRVIRVPRDEHGVPIGKDPDECLRADAHRWREAVEGAVPVLDYELSRVRTQFDCTTPAGKRDAARVLVARLAHIVDPIERAAWAQRGADALDVPESALREAVAAAGRAMRTRATSNTSSATGGEQQVRQDPVERFGNRLLALLIRHPDQGKRVFESFVVDNFVTPKQQALYKTLHLGYSKQESLHGANVMDTEQRDFVERLEFFADREFGDLPTAAITSEIDQCTTQLRRHAVDKKLHDIKRRMKVLEDHAGDPHAREHMLALERAFHELADELSLLHAAT